MTTYSNYMPKTKLAEALPKGKKKTCIFEICFKVIINGYA